MSSILEACSKKALEQFLLMQLPTDRGAGSRGFGSLNGCKCHLDVYVGYLRLGLYQEYGTGLLGIIQAPRVLRLRWLHFDAAPLQSLPSRTWQWRLQLPEPGGQGAFNVRMDVNI